MESRVVAFLTELFASAQNLSHVSMFQNCVMLRCSLAVSFIELLLERPKVRAKSMQKLLGKVRPCKGRSLQARGRSRLHRNVVK